MTTFILTTFKTIKRVLRLPVKLIYVDTTLTLKKYIFVKLSQVSYNPEQNKYIKQ